jgi:hypothetical protein
MEPQHHEQSSSDSAPPTGSRIAGPSGYNTHPKQTINDPSPDPSSERVTVPVLTALDSAIVKEVDVYLFPLKTARIEVYFQDKDQTFIARVPRMTVSKWYDLLLHGRPPSETSKQLVLEWEHDGKVARRVLVGRNDVVEEVGVGFDRTTIAFGVWRRVVVVLEA